MTGAKDPSGQDGREETDPRAAVAERVAAAREAMAAIQGYDQAAADELARAAGRAVYREERAESLVETTLRETGIGNREDKLEKTRRRVKGILTDALDEQTVGRVDADRSGVVEIAKPVGVVGALVPSTNPAPTTANLAILALKGRNALVVSASPAGTPPVAEAVEYIREELAAAGAPRDLVQMVPRPASKEKATALTDLADLVQVTGSAANVEIGETSGTPNYCVSEGNPVALVDDGVDLDRVAEAVTFGAAYDEGLACVCESCLVATEGHYERLRDSLTAAGAYRCDERETDRLRRTLFPDGELDRSVIGRPAGELADEAGIDDDAARAADVLVVEPTDLDDDPLVTECLAPVLAAVAAPDFEGAIDVAERVLEREGTGHSATVHTTDRSTAVRVGERLPVCRMAVNQPNLASGGGFENGLTHTLSMGGGTWAGNQLERNLSAREFIQTTRVAFQVSETEPTAAEVFGFDDDG